MSVSRIPHRTSLITIPLELPRYKTGETTTTDFSAVIYRDLNLVDFVLHRGYIRALKGWIYALFGLKTSDPAVPAEGYIYYRIPRPNGYVDGNTPTRSSSNSTDYDRFTEIIELDQEALDVINNMQRGYVRADLKYRTTGSATAYAIYYATFLVLLVEMLGT